MNLQGGISPVKNFSGTIIFWSKAERRRPSKTLRPKRHSKKDNARIRKLRLKAVHAS